MRWLAPFLLALLAVPASAHGATVSVTTAFIQSGKAGGYYVDQAEFVADARERNDVSARQDGDAVIVRDEGAVLRAGTGCTRVDDHSARCVPRQAGRFRTVWLRLGDEDDRFADAGLLDTSAVDGGPGSDVLQGGRGSLDGGEGADRVVAGAEGAHLLGGPGPDELVGGAGRDLLEGDPAEGPFAADAMDGGAGIDTVTYFRRTVGVRVDLMVVSGHGAAGENDTVLGVESIAGGDGADALAGDNGDNALFGGGAGGGDVVIGRGGDDEVQGSPPRTRSAAVRATTT